MNALELKNICYSYHEVDKETRALYDVNLEVKSGSFVSIVGPSGCGKSTTLRMIAGLENISKGEFLIDGVRANEMGPREREIAMVFQSYALYPQMSVYDNIAFGLSLQGVDDDIIDAKVVSVKPDGKLDLTLREKAYIQMDADAEKILELLEDYAGVLPFSEKASPEVIKRETGLSKNAFKRAVGRLLKEEKIVINEKNITIL